MEEKRDVEVDIKLYVRFVDKASCRKDGSLRVIKHVGMLKSDDESIEDDKD